MRLKSGLNSKNNSIIGVIGGPFIQVVLLQSLKQRVQLYVVFAYIPIEEVPKQNSLVVSPLNCIREIIDIFFRNMRELNVCDEYKMGRSPLFN